MKSKPDHGGNPTYILWFARLMLCNISSKNFALFQSLEDPKLNELEFEKGLSDLASIGEFSYSYYVVLCQVRLPNTAQLNHQLH